jgi:hypothetical protein
MYKGLLITAACAAAMAAPLSAQNYQRRASIQGSGNPYEGKCTVEVVVDGAADVEIRGDSAVLRNLAGRPPEWRRFVCTAPMPVNPANFRFQGVDGRGLQQLVRDPRNGGPAVIHIEDRDGGAEGYTFDVFWNGGGNPGGYYGGERREYFQDRNRPRAFTTDQAVRVCQDSVRDEARNRFGARDVQFLNTRMDDNAGRNDWVIGSFETRGRYEDRHRFACSVNFDNGHVRSVEIDPGR